LNDQQYKFWFYDSHLHCSQTISSVKSDQTIEAETKTNTKTSFFISLYNCNFKLHNALERDKLFMARWRT